MRYGKLHGIVLLLGLGLASWPGSVPGQPGPSPSVWASGASETGNANPPVVIASTKANSKQLPADARMPLPDDGLPNPPAPPAPSTPARARVDPAPPGEIQRTNFTPGTEPPAPVRRTPGDVTPALTGSILGVEIEGTNAATPGQPYPCQILVRNHGDRILSQVRVELPIPIGVRVQATQPNAERPGDRLSWLIGNLESRGERRLRVELLPSEAGDLHLCPTASYTTALGLRANIVRPPFALSLSGPETAAVGDRVVLAIQIGNHTTDPLRLVSIRCQLGQGLWHSQGEVIEADLTGGLAAGERKTIHLQAETRGTGRIPVQVSASADSRHVASASHLVTVNEPSLAVQMQGPRRGVMGHQMAYRVEIANPGKVAATGVKVRQSLPQGLEFVTADTAASHDPGSGTILWNLGDLAGGDRRSVTFQVKAKQAGDWAMPMTLLAEGMAEARSTHSLHVEAAPTLALELSADDDPIDQGRETTYEVRIFNQGDPVGDVSLTAYLPDHVAATGLNGPTRPREQGQVIVFEPLPLLKNRAAVYRLRLRGLKPGSGQFRVEVSAAGLASPLQRELATRVRGAPAGSVSRSQE